MRTTLNRFLRLAGAVALLALSSSAAILYQKSATGQIFPTTGGAGSVTLVPSNTGDLIVVSAFAPTTATTFNVSDTSGITWLPVVTLQTTQGGGMMQSWYGYAKSTASISISVAFANATNYNLEMVADEFSGIAASGLDKNTYATGSATTSPITLGPLIPASNGELLWAVGNSGSINGIGTGFTAGVSFDITKTEYRVLSGGSGTSTPATFPTDSAGSGYAAMYATFTAASAGSPVFGVSPASVTFPATAQQGVSSAQTVTVTNSGTAALTVSGVSLTGANPSDFTQTNNCSSIAASATCTISAVFRPSAIGTRAATLSIADNATGSPHTVALSGTGGASLTSYRNGSATFEGPINFCGADTGTGNAYVCANPVGATIGAYRTGQFYSFQATHSNTAAVSLAIDGLTAVAIKKQQGTADLVLGDIAANSVITVKYNGTVFQMETHLANAPSGGSGGFANPMTTAGDTLYQGAGGPSRVPGGTAGYVYTSNGPTAPPVWSAAGTGSNSYTASANSALPRTVTSKLQETVSVKDFGAVGDGATDDTSAIQTAINTTQGNNGALYFPPGKYKITATLNVSNPLTLYGEMGTVCTDSSPWCGSQIYYTGTATAVYVHASYDVHRVYFRDLTISSAGGKGVADSGIWFDNVEESGLERVNIGDYGGSGNEKLGFRAAIKTNHWAIGWIIDCNFEDDTYIVDGEGGFMAQISMAYCNTYRIFAAFRIDGGSQTVSIRDSWFESTHYLVYADSANARLQGVVIDGNHENSDSGNDSTLTDAKIMRITNAGASYSGVVVSGNTITLNGPSSFFDFAPSGGAVVLIANLLGGSPSQIFSGSGTATVATLGNGMPGTLGAATRITQ